MKNLFQSRNLVLGITTVGLNLAVISPQAMAFSLTWTLDNASFIDGGTASGSFDYDADTNEYTNINISTTASDNFEAVTYNDGSFSSRDSDSDSLVLSIPDPSSPTQTLTLEFSRPLTNAGGTNALRVDESPFSQEQTFSPVAFRKVTSGEVSAVPFEFSPTAGIILSLCLFGIPILKNKLTLHSQASTRLES